MKKVVITNTYFYKLDPKQWVAQQPYPPLGTLYAAEMLRSNGYQVYFHDSTLADSPDEVASVLQKENPDYFIIYDDGFNYLTKMCLTIMRDAALAMQKMAKASGAVVITSSSDSTDHYLRYLKEGADFVIQGEGEVTLRELLEKLATKQDIATVPGLAFSRQQEVIQTTKRPVVKNLDELPLPAWDLVNIENYRSIWLKSHHRFYLNVATTRGCPYKCNWCAKPIYGNRYNSRSPQKVVAELKYLYHRYGVDHFWMCDDIFGLKPGWIKEFEEAVKKAAIKIRYKIQSRADLLLEKNTIESLVNSGLDEAWIGAESGSQKVLDAMDKGITIPQIYQATKLLKQNGVKVGFFIQFGYPAETISDIRKTFRMVLDLMPDALGISVSYPLPGTPFYQSVRDDLKQKSNWVDSDDMEVMFRHRYPPRFYKVLHRFLHRMYRCKKLRIELLGKMTKPQLSVGITFLKWGYHFTNGLMEFFQLAWIERKASSKTHHA